MNKKERYIELCAHETLPLHAQAWWMEKSSIGKEWDAILIENSDQRTEAAMPYHLVHKFGLRAILMPIHTQYHYAYFSSCATEDTFTHLVEAIEQECRTQHISWYQTQGFYPEPMISAFQKHGFSISKRITYRIATIPERSELPKLFSQNKRRQLRKANGMQLTNLQADAFYAFHKECMSYRGKHIDYPEEWATAVLSEAVRRGEGVVIGAKNQEGILEAAMFLAWDNKWAYYLLPTYHPAHKDSGAMAWLTYEALCIARGKGLGFDFEGSMIPSIALSYKQFGGTPVTYYRIEKFYNPIMRALIKLRQWL